MIQYKTYPRCSNSIIAKDDYEEMVYDTVDKNNYLNYLSSILDNKDNSDE